ncbi:unnamed protein product [Acanthosepion pharaonis]|uniref:Uncharacterized protein n=1 Tax=Acanthosepion pharaonis TaxID=158019 RepID=A0A812DXM5_ACAPH|nr:unnamed protein product [Sepia pharaonis]
MSLSLSLSLYLSIYLSIYLSLDSLKIEYALSSYLSAFLCSACSKLSSQGTVSSNNYKVLFLVTKLPPFFTGNYAFLLRPLEGENLLKTLFENIRVCSFFSNGFSSKLHLWTSFQTFFSGASSRGLSLKGKFALSNLVTHASFFYGQMLPAFSARREKNSCLSAVSFSPAAKVQSQFSFPFQRGGGHL